MRGLLPLVCRGFGVLAVLLICRPAVAEDPLPEPLTRRFADQPAFSLPRMAESKPYRLRTIEADDTASEGSGLRSLFSVLDPLFRPRAGEPEIMPLVHSETVDLLPVSTLSLPNPFALLGNPARWGGRFRAAYGTNFNDGTLLHGNLIIDRGLPLGFDSEINYREDPRRVLDDRRFWNGDFNVVYHLKQIRYVGFRLGIGANWLTDGAHTDVGFNTTYGFDIRLKKPFYATTTIDYGWLGSKQMLHWQISGGLDFGRFELFIGYDFFEVGSRERKNVLAGAGIWW